MKKFLIISITRLKLLFYQVYLNEDSPPIVRQHVCHGLQAVLLLRLNPALFEGEVVVEEEDEQVPEDLWLQQVHPQVAVNRPTGLKRTRAAMA